MSLVKPVSRPIALFTAAMLVLLLSSCATLFGPRDVNLSLAQLEEAMAKKFPFNNRVLELFDISLSNPRLTLEPGTNRILTTMDASLAPPFINRSLKGSFALSGALRLDPSRSAVLLAEPRLENVAIDGLNVNHSGFLGKVGRLVAEQLLDGMVIYSFQPDQLRVAGTQFLPTKINTRSDGLVITFEPAR